MNRRTFLSGAVAGAVAMACKARTGAAAAPAERAVRVVVWDEQQPEQKKVYDNFLGNVIADHLRGRGGFDVRSVNFADPEQGLGDEVLSACDVLVWWSHYRTNGKIKPEATQKILERIQEGSLSLVTLHSAHWS